MTVEGILYRYSARHAKRAMRAGIGLALLCAALLFGLVGLGDNSLLIASAGVGVVGVLFLVGAVEDIEISMDDLSDIEEACDMNTSLLGRLQAEHDRQGRLTYGGCLRALHEVEPKRAPLRLPRHKIQRLMHVPGRSFQ